MKGTEDEQLQDDFEQPPHRRAPKPAVIIAIVALVVLGSFTAVHLLGGGGLAPAPTLEPGSNLFYIATSPGWGSISIDGQTLSHLPVMGVDQPLQLSPGVHQVAWQAVPFPTQHCILVVPPDVTTTRCLANDKVPVPKHQDLTAFVLTFSASTAMLPDAQQAALFQAAQAMLDTLQATETVQPGEQYVDLQASHFVTSATQPLRAALHFQLDTNSSAACQGEFIGTFNACSNQGQDCHLFCAQQVSSLAFTPQRWDVFAVIRPTWDYTTLSGQVVARNQPDAPDNAGTEYIISLSITWGGSRWHVSTHSPNNPPLVDPACAAVSGRIPYNANLQSEESNPSIAIYWQFAAGPDHAAGCLAEAFQTPEILGAGNTPRPIAYCLYRFGVFVAVDAAAHRYWPGLPVADSYEQSTAKQLEALPAA